MPQPKKRFGQHFLRDPEILARIITAIDPQKDEHLVEIGPGPGALTVELLPYLNSLDVIEIDRDIIPLLKTNCKSIDKLNIYEQDVLTFDFANLAEKNIPLRVVGNLPYNISTPLIFHLFHYISHLKDMHFMLQKEVAERICAEVGTKHYGRLSVMTQYFCQTELLFFVPPTAFYPPPKVYSAVIRLVSRQSFPLNKSELEIFATIVKQAFMYRRKTIHNALKGVVTAEHFQLAEIDPQLRAERLTIDDFVKLAAIVAGNSKRQTPALCNFSITH